MLANPNVPADIVVWMQTRWAIYYLAPHGTPPPSGVTRGQSRPSPIGGAGNARGEYAVELGIGNVVGEEAEVSSGGEGGEEAGWVEVGEECLVEFGSEHWRMIVDVVIGLASVINN